MCTEGNALKLIRGRRYDGGLLLPWEIPTTQGLAHRAYPACHPAVLHVAEECLFKRGLRDAGIYHAELVAGLSETNGDVTGHTI